jgi:ABC-2 type transport system permease protein
MALDSSRSTLHAPRTSRSPLHAIRYTLLKYTAITTTNLQNQLAYIWDALNRAFFIIIILFVFVQLWTAAYANRDATVIAGLTLANTIWYFLIAEAVELGKFRHDVKISEEVKDGSIAYTLNRPYNYLAYHFFNGLGETAVKMLLVFLLGSPIALYYAGLPTVQLIHLPAVLLILFLALLLDFFILSIIGLLAFVTEDTFSFRLIYQKLVFILGGLLIPVDFLPGPLQTIARLLPFNLTIYAPSKLFVAFTWAQFTEILTLQLLWLLLIGGFLYLQYRWAVQRLSVNGG